VNDSCRGWDVAIPKPGHMGDCEHFRTYLSCFPPTMFKSGQLYWMTDSTPHEALPMPPGYRQWFRFVTSAVSVWYSRHSTPNRLGVKPACDIIHESKFTELQ